MQPPSEYIYKKSKSKKTDNVINTNANSNITLVTMIGSHDEAEESVKVPSKTRFEFTPATLPHQNIFNIDTHPSTWSASSLNHRYQQRLKQERLSSSRPTTTVLATSRYGQTAAAASTTAISPTPSVEQWSNYVYHRTLSSTIMGYIHLLVSVVMFSTLGYILFQLIWTLQQDFQIKADEYTHEIIREIQVCAHQYEINLCHPETRVPALEKKCQHWLDCSNRMPSHVTRAKVSAEAMADIFNSFFDALSYKTLALLIFLCFGYILVSASTFRLYRRTNPAPL